MTYTVEADTLTQFGTNVLTALGVPTDDAHLLSLGHLLPDRDARRRQRQDGTCRWPAAATQ